MADRAELRSWQPSYFDDLEFSTYRALKSMLGESVARRAAKERRMAAEAVGAVGEGVGSIITQPVTAGNALAEAALKPSIPTATNAAFQTGLALMQPLKAAGALGAGYAAGAASDAGMFDMQAQAAPKKQTTFPNGFTAEQLQSIADRTGMDVQTLGGLTKRRINDLIQSTAAASGAAAIEAQSAEKRAQREEYDRAVKMAEAARDKELARYPKDFKDTNIGQIYEQTGGYAPFIAAAGLGALSRAATGPGKSAAGKVAYNYALPFAEGAAGGFAAVNAPYLYDMGLQPKDNPERAAFLAYARDLPAGHPRKQEAEEYARKLPELNPRYTGAMNDFFAHAPERAAMAGVEGIAGVAGANAVRMLGRPFQRDGVAATGSGQPAAPTGPTGGFPPGAGPRRGRGNQGQGPGATPGPIGPQGPGPNAGASKNLLTAERDLIRQAAYSRPGLTPQDVIAANPSLAGKDAQIQAYINRVEQALTATGKRNRSAAAKVVENIQGSNLAVPLAIGAGGAAGYGSLADFEQALAGFNHALVDLDGDGRPDAVVNEPMGLGNRYTGGY